MKAIHVTQYGGPEVLEAVDVPEPVLGKHQIAVKMKVTGYNFHFGGNSQSHFSRPSNTRAIYSWCRRNWHCGSSGR